MPMSRRRSSLQRLTHPAWVITCEHAGNQVPPPWDEKVAIPKRVLDSHLGIDVGVKPLAQAIAHVLEAPLYMQETSRLLIECNRTLGTPKLFSRYTRSLPHADKQALVDTLYIPYREKVEHEIAALVGKGRQVIHLSIHSFTPVRRGKRREAEVGLLYDPSRPLELAFALEWQSTLRTGFKVRRNWPYKGVDDGFTKELRKRYPATTYLGLEIEVRHDLLKKKAENTIAAVTQSISLIKERL